MTSSDVTRPTISVRYVTRLLELAERDGALPADLLARAGMAPIVEDHPDVRVPTDDYYRLWDVTMSSLGDPSFPFRLADSMDSASFDALGFAVVTSASYGDALQRIRRYLPFVTDGARWSIRREGDVAVLGFAQDAERTPAHRYVDEFSMAHLVVVGRKLTSAAWKVRSVRFEHPEPEDTRALRAFFRAPIAFDSDATELRLPWSALELPFQKAHPSMAAFFDRHIESVLERSRPDHDFIVSVRRLLAESLVTNAYSLEDVARRLAMSPRTLRRRLSEHGVRYRELLESIRRELADRYLRERTMSLGEIAYALGYADPAAFHRAFRRWTNVTPAAYRASHRPGGGRICQ